MKKNTIYQYTNGVAMKHVKGRRVAVLEDPLGRGVDILLVRKDIPPEETSFFAKKKMFSFHKGTSISKINLSREGAKALQILLNEYFMEIDPDEITFTHPGNKEE